MLTKTERALDLVANRLVSRAVHVVVLGAADFVAEGLSSGLLRVWGIVSSCDCGDDGEEAYRAEPRERPCRRCR